jgi:hypothetical protein
LPPPRAANINTPSRSVSHCGLDDPDVLMSLTLYGPVAAEVADPDNVNAEDAINTAATSTRRPKKASCGWETIANLRVAQHIGLSKRLAGEPC